MLEYSRRIGRGDFAEDTFSDAPEEHTSYPRRNFRARATTSKEIDRIFRATLRLFRLFLLSQTISRCNGTKAREFALSRGINAIP